MAYFSNGSEGMCFDDQCAKCHFGRSPCPIAKVQQLYNYDACNNEVATKILDELVKNDGTCNFFNMAQTILEIDPNQLKIGFNG